MKISFWDVLTVLTLLGTIALGVVFVMLFNNPTSAGMFGPPTLPATVQIPSSTPTLRKLPATWTPTPTSEYDLKPFFTPESSNGTPEYPFLTLFPSLTPYLSLTPVPPTEVPTATSPATITPTITLTSNPTPTSVVWYPTYPVPVITFNPPTVAPVVPTPTVPGNTATPTHTQIPTRTLTPTRTNVPVVPSNTPVPVNTLPPTATRTSVPSLTPKPTFTRTATP